MKSVQEIRDFLDNVDCGEPIFNIGLGYGDISISLSDWAYKKGLGHSKNWLTRSMAGSLRRKYSHDEKKLILVDKDRTLRDAYRHISCAIVDVAKETSPADQPKRTKAYKGIVEITHSEMNETFINDILPVLNYYFNAKTDSNESMNMKVHKTNTFALLEILRKKHESKSSS